MSETPRLVDRIGQCRIYEGVMELNPRGVKICSTFCESKNVSSITFLTRGGYGLIYNIVIDGVDYILKKQSINLLNTFVQSEKEVSFPELLKDVRRKDGQRISIPTFDCFFVCNQGQITDTFCTGDMFYIMEKGVANCAEMILLNTGSFSTRESRVILIRDSLMKMIENINLLVETHNMVWWDLKPGNTVFNYKLNVNTGSVEINPILIDLDEHYICDSFEQLVDKEKLNYLLGNLEIDGRRIFTYELEDHHLIKIYSFIMSFSYLFQFMNTFDKLRSRTGNIIFDMVLGMSIFNKRTLDDDSTITPYDVLRIMFNPKRDDKWINAALQILLKTSYADSTHAGTKSEILRRNFYHYAAHGVHGSYSDKFNNVYRIFKDYYGQSMSFLKEENKFKETNIDMNELAQLNEQMRTDRNLQEYIESVKDVFEESNNNLEKLNSDQIPNHNFARGAIASSRPFYSRVLNRFRR
jgi:hypothetical protein